MKLFQKLFKEGSNKSTTKNKPKIINHKKRALTIKEVLDKLEYSLPHKLDKKNKKNVIELFTKSKEEKHYARSHKELLNKMTRSYHIKSKKQLEYFIKNVANAHDTLNKKPMIDFNSLKNLSLYSQLRKNITFNKYDELCIDEKLKGDFLYNIDKKYATKKLAKIFYIQEIVKQQKDHYSAYMLTFTNPSQYIFYKQINSSKKINYGEFENFKKNSKYNKNNGLFEESILRGAKLQKEINRHFYKDLKQRIKRCDNSENVELFHFTIFESTKQLHFHSHKLLLVPSKYYRQVREAFENTTKYFKLEQVKFDELEEIKNSKKNQAKGQRLKNAKASSYVYKYLFKTMKAEINLNDKNTQELFNKDTFFNIFRRYFAKEHRIFTSSNFLHTTQKKIDIMYKFLKENYPEYLKKLKEKGSLYYQLEQLELRKTFTFKTITKYRYSIDTSKLKLRLKELEEKYIENLDKSYNLAKMDLFEEFQNDLLLFKKDGKLSHYVKKTKQISLESCHFVKSCSLNRTKCGIKKLIFHHQMYELKGFTEDELCLIH